MKKYRVSRKKDGLLIIDLYFYDKKIQKVILEKLKKQKNINVNLVEV